MYGYTSSWKRETVLQPGCTLGTLDLAYKRAESITVEGLLTDAVKCIRESKIINIYKRPFVPEPRAGGSR